MFELSDLFLGALDISIPVLGYFVVAEWKFLNWQEGMMPEFGQVLGWCEFSLWVFCFKTLQTDQLEVEVKPFSRVVVSIKFSAVR